MRNKCRRVAELFKVLIPVCGTPVGRITSENDMCIPNILIRCLFIFWREQQSHRLSLDRSSKQYPKLAVSRCQQDTLSLYHAWRRKCTYRRIAYGVIYVGANLDNGFRARIVREAPCIVETRRWICLRRTHFHWRCYLHLGWLRYQLIIIIKHSELLHNMLWSHFDFTFYLAQ